ncbi:hypothetical protein E1293_07290 [Actinomadura darangshiensis]|uniref:Uncharacterized protein n=1 Tax=Actinomadura darangshiensis TaxID=705336 RepID=A0A4R5BQM1_9ACTN|nr:hypothetical protein [Actinomadura darangshiensis]TDD87806.1 hypothetical protein E1293_07290 [Actinomadura darangshiensis]
MAAIALSLSALVEAQDAPLGAAQAKPGRHPAPWERYNLSPSSRTLHPASVYKTEGAVTDANALLGGRKTRLDGAGASITLDFGKEVSGLATLHFAGSDGPQKVGAAFAGSSTYVDIRSDASTGGPPSQDGALSVDVDGRTSYTTPAEQVSLHYTAAPQMKDPSKYANYFYSSDDLLNRIWYAGLHDPAQHRLPEDRAGLGGAGGAVGQHRRRRRRRHDPRGRR